MVKKERRAAFLEASAAYHQVLEEDSARSRFRYLLQDYEELQMETDAKKKNLLKAKLKKQRLLGEVKFLRAKYQTLVENPSQTAVHRLKKQSHKIALPSAGTNTQPAGLQISTRKNRLVVDAAKPKTCTLLDLNQVSLPFGDGAKELETDVEPLSPVNMLKARLMNGRPKDQKPPICRDVGRNANRADTRKITWQDQVVLRV